DVSMPTDDWPFLYLRTRGIPAMYLTVMIALGLFVGLFALYLQVSGRKHHTRAPSDVLVKGAFFCMGIAFLLLETKSVIQFSLLFGTTWQNNSFVFLTVLVLVLAANWAAGFFSSEGRALPITFGLLVVSSLATLVYPVQKLLAVEAVWLRVVLAALLTL